MSPPPSAPPESPAGPSLWRLTGVFLRLGAQAFGGLGATLGLLERDLVAHRRWVSASDLRDSLTYTKPLPGSTVVQVVTYLGWRLRGPAGAVATTVAFLTPAVLVMTAAAAGTAALPDVAVIRGALLGLQVAVVGVLAATAVRLLRSEARSRSTAAVAVGALGAGLVVNAAVVVGAAGLGAVIVWWVRRRRSGPSEDGAGGET